MKFMARLKENKFLEVKMKYYKIISWSRCPWCVRAKSVMVQNKAQFEYCLLDESRELLNYYKSIYNHKSVPMIVEINASTGQEKFIGGYTDLIKHFQQPPAKTEIRHTDGES